MKCRRMAEFVVTLRDGRKTFFQAKTFIRRMKDFWILCDSLFGNVVSQVLEIAY